MKFGSNLLYQMLGRLLIIFRRKRKLLLRLTVFSYEEFYRSRVNHEQFRIYSLLSIQIKLEPHPILLNVQVCTALNQRYYSQKVAPIFSLCLFSGLLSKLLYSYYAPILHNNSFLIILYTMSPTFALFVLLLLSPSFAEPIDFNYTSHGSDWNCPKNGSKQSPILLSTSQKITKSKDSYLLGDYANSTGIVNFLNTTIYINTADTFGVAYTKLIDESSVPFKATEIKIRMHSEHKTEDGYFDLEVQIFHSQLYQTSRNYKFAIGLLFNIGQTADPLLQNIIDAYSKNNSSSTPISVDLRPYLGPNVIDDFWFYTGSQTIPPCTDGKLNWVINRKVFSLTKDQNDKLLVILSNNIPEWSGNWRQIQAQNTNIVGFRHIEPVTGTQ